MDINLRDSVKLNIKLFKIAALSTYTTNANINRLVEISEVGSLLPNLYAAIIKNLLFRQKSVQIQEMIDYLDDGKFQAKNPKQQQILKDAVRLSKQSFYCFFIVVFSYAFVMIVISPLFHLNENRLPWPTTYEYNSRFLFVCVYIIQTVGPLMCACNNIAMDTFFGSNMIQIGGQCDLLHDDIVNMVNDNNQQLVGDYDYLKQTLIGCVAHHRLTLQYSKQLLNIFNELVMVQFICSVIAICFSTFALSLTPPTDPRFLSLFLYQLIVYIQIILYCWFGTRIQIKSDKLCYGVFETNWLDCPAEFKKDLLFFMVAVKEPLVLFICGIIPVNVVTLSGILRSSWAYFTGLNNIQKSH